MRTGAKSGASVSGVVADGTARSGVGTSAAARSDALRSVAGNATTGSLSPVESHDPEAAGARGDSERRVVRREHQVG